MNSFVPKNVEKTWNSSHERYVKSILVINQFFDELPLSISFNVLSSRASSVVPVDLATECAKPSLAFAFVRSDNGDVASTLEESTFRARSVVRATRCARCC